MNERIRELAKQLDDGTFIDGMGFGEGNIEGLAELIVRECANQCTHDGPFTAEVVWGKQFREKILKHFGIDE